MAGRARVLGGDPARGRRTGAQGLGDVLLASRRDPDPRSRPGRSAVHPAHDAQSGSAAAREVEEAGQPGVHAGPYRPVHRGRRGAGPYAVRPGPGDGPRRGRHRRSRRRGDRRLRPAQPRRPAGRPGAGARTAVALDAAGHRLPGPGRGRRPGAGRGGQAGESTVARDAEGHVRVRPPTGRAQTALPRGRRADDPLARRPTHRRRAGDVLLPAHRRRQRHCPQRGTRRTAGPGPAPGAVRATAQRGP